LVTIAGSLPSAFHFEKFHVKINIMDINLILEIFAYVAMKYFEYSVVPMV
jgi:hypothetical protein